MNQKTKKKLCWNCEGRVDFSAEHCPFCGVYLSPSTTQSVEQQEHSPSYTETPTPQHSAPPPPYQRPFDDPMHNESFPQNESEDIRGIVVSLSALLAGSVFFLFGLVLLLFSRNGNLVLQWSGEYWYLYLCGGILMLLIGWRTVQQLDTED